MSMRTGPMALLVVVIAAGLVLWLVQRDDAGGTGSSSPAEVPSEPDPEPREARPDGPDPEAPGVIERLPFVAPNDEAAAEDAGRPAVTVRVLTMADRPCEGVPVVMKVMTLRWRAVSGPDGEARFVGWEEELAALSGDPIGVVALDMPLAVPSPASVDLRQPSDEAIVLRMPATLGAVEVQIVDGNRDPLAAPSKVSLGNGRLVQPPAQGLDGPGTFDGRDAVAVERGSHLFSHVESGVPLVLDVFPADPLRRLRERLPPLEANERRVVRVTVKDRYPVLMGRVVDQTGSAIANATLVFGVNYERGGAATGMGVGGTSDGEGRFRLTVDFPWEGASTREVTVGLQGLPSEGRSITLPHPLPPADIPVGDVEVALPPELQVLFAGVVVAGDEPLAEATIRVEPAATQDPVDGIRRRAYSWLHATSDAQGRFEIRGKDMPPRCRLVVMHPEGWMRDPLPVSPGDMGLVVRVERAGSLVGRVLLSPGVKTRLIHLRVAIDPDPRHASTTYVTPDSDGSFRVGSLPPGRGRLLVSWRSNYGAPPKREQLCEIENLEIAPDHECRDPRLDPLDLRDAIKTIAITIVDEEGLPVPNAWHGTLNSRWNLPKDAVFHTQVAKDGLTIVIGAPGRVPVALEGVRDDQRVVLRKANDVDLTVVGLDLPDPSFNLLIFVEGQDVIGIPEELSGAVRERVVLDDQGRGRLQLPLGRYACDVSVEVRRDSRVLGAREWRGLKKGAYEPSEIEVTEAPAAFVIRVDPDAVEQLIKRGR